jgi:hypothetical protein
MKAISQVIVAVAVAAGLTLGAAGTGTAQGKAGGPATRVRHTPAGHPSDATKPKHASDTFQGVAKKLGTTPDALESAYQTAKQANPKLKRGQFVAANILAQNLGSKNPAITTQAILSGLQSGKSIGQTLQSLGLSSKDARAAERQADRDAKEADRAEDRAEKPKTP